MHHYVIGAVELFSVPRVGNRCHRAIRRLPRHPAPAVLACQKPALAIECQPVGVTARLDMNLRPPAWCVLVNSRCVDVAEKQVAVRVPQRPFGKLKIARQLLWRLGRNEVGQRTCHRIPPFLISMNPAYRPGGKQEYTRYLITRFGRIEAACQDDPSFRCPHHHSPAIAWVGRSSV